jgi:cephalosporin hydroxylase
MFIREEFESKKREQASAIGMDLELRRKAIDLLVASDARGYAYQWTWLGLPIIQLPPDILALQEIIWETKPDIVIETGIAWGGSVVLYASLLQLIGKGEVVAVDLNLMGHVSAQIMSYPFSNRIHMYKGSSTDPSVVARVKSHIKPGQSVMVVLDSNHTHDHVLDELRIFAPLVTKNQFLVVCDTYLEEVPLQVHRPRAWGPGNNPGTALQTYLRETDSFEEDPYINQKVLLTFNPHGFLRRVR